MRCDCEVRYIITVNALKEGWDCPFAYILATLANKTSKVDVEQILGRILRQPYTTQHGISLLNLSYVFTSSNDFRNTTDGIIRSLQKVGFSRKDFRDVTPESLEVPNSQPTPEIKTLFPANTENGDKDIETEHEEELKLEINNVEEFKNEIEAETVSPDIQLLQQQAMQVCDEYTQIIEEQTDKGEIDPLASITPQEMYYPIKSQFREVAHDMNLPIFYRKTSQSVFFANEEWIPLEKSMLSENFDLSTKDADIDFTIVRPAGITIDVAESGDAVRKNNQSLTDFIRNQYVDKSASIKKEGISGQLAGMIKLDEVSEPAIRSYVKRAIDRLDADQIENLIDNIYLTRDAIKEKIESLLKDHRRKTFGKWLTTGRIKLKGHYTFTDNITFRNELVGIDKGLYAAEENVNGFEYDAIAAIAEHPNVLFWHRNRDRKEFVINGFINHYPDFIVRMRSGKTLLIETKGDHLANAESIDKIRLGKDWAALAGDKYRYFMVFESKEVGGAITLKTLLQYLNEL